jgi:hypothetical protein
MFFPGYSSRVFSAVGPCFSQNWHDQIVFVSMVIANSFYSLSVSTSFCHVSLKEKHIYILEDQRPFFAARHTSRSTSFCGEIPDWGPGRTQQKTLLKAQVFAHPFAVLLGTVYGTCVTD